MRVTAGGQTYDLGDTESGPTIGITDYSRRVTDDFGVTTVVERGFSRTMSVRFALPLDAVDGLQQRLAGLRATPALWVADDRWACLSVQGILKDFDSELVAAQSYCRLTVEGTAETDVATDGDGDAAPFGLASTMRLLRPIIITPAQLVGTTVPETDHPAWDASAAYAFGTRVIQEHRVYESLIVNNVGHDPGGGDGAWVEVGPTNRWAMFDQALGTATAQAGSVGASIQPSEPVDSVALLDVVGDTVRVQAPSYDRTVPVVGGAIVLTDLPPPAAFISVTVSGSGTVSVGTLLIGQTVGLGLTETSPTAGITDYSRKEVDDFGAVTIVQRGYAKRMAANALVASGMVDAVAARLTAARARPSLWLGQAGLDSLTIYGFPKDWSIEVGEGTSKLSLSVEGLSTAAPASAGLTLDWQAITDKTGTKPANNATNSADPASPLGPDKTVGQVLAGQAAAAAAIQAVQDALEGTDLGDTAAAGAARQAAEAARDAAAGSAQTATQAAGAATLKASDAAGAAQLAADKAAAAATYAKLSASIGPGTTNANPTFADWPEGVHTIPVGWSDWLDGGNLASKVPGINGRPNAYEAQTPAGANQGIVQHLDQCGAGWWVVEAEWTLVAGDLSGAGVYVVANAAAANAETKQVLLASLEANGAPIGAGTVGRTYRASRLLHLTDAGIDNLYLYLMTAWTNFGQPIAAKTIRWHKLALRPASAPEIAAQQAAVDATTALAEIVTEQGARVSGDSAQAARTDGLVAQMAGATPSGLKASIQETATAGANATKAVADRTETLEAQVAGTTASGIKAIATASATAAAAAAQKVDTLTAAITAGRDNLQRNGGFESGTTGMTLYSPAGVDYDPPSNRTVFHWENSGQSLFLLPAIDVKPGGTYTISYDAHISVPAGGVMRIDPSCWTGADATGNPTYDALSEPGYGPDYDTDRDGRRQFTITVPGDCHSIQLRIVSNVPGGGPISMWMARIKVEAGGAPATAYSVEASVKVASGVAADARGRLSAVSFTTASAGGNVARLGVYADGYGAGILLDAPTVTITGQLLAPYSVPTAAVAPNAITGYGASTGSEGYIEGDGGFASSNGATIVAQGGLIKIDISFDFKIFNGSGGAFSAQLLRNGGPVSRKFILRTTSDIGVPFTLIHFDDPGAGTHTYTLAFGKEVSGSAEGYFNNAGVYLMEFKR